MAQFVTHIQPTLNESKQGHIPHYHQVNVPHHHPSHSHASGHHHHHQQPRNMTLPLNTHQVHQYTKSYQKQDPQHHMHHPYQHYKKQPQYYEPHQLQHHSHHHHSHQMNSVSISILFLKKHFPIINSYYFQPVNSK